jgi:hypothetical protein
MKFTKRIKIHEKKARTKRTHTKLQSQSIFEPNSFEVAVKYASDPSCILKSRFATIASNL